MEVEPELALGLGLRPLELMRLPGLEVLLLRLVIELRKQLEMELLLELQLVERLRQEQERRLELVRFAPGLLPGFGLQRGPLEFEPALGLGLLRELRPLELMRLPGLEVRQLRLVIELELQLALELKLVELQVVELLRQE